MTVKKPPGKPPSRDPRSDPTHPLHYGAFGSWRHMKPPEPKEARVSLRLHDFLREAMEFISSADRRPLATYIEAMLLDHAADMLENPFLSDGRRDPADKSPLRMKNPRR